MFRLDLAAVFIRRFAFFFFGFVLASVAILKFRSADEGNDNDYKILGMRGVSTRLIRWESIMLKANSTKFNSEIF